MRVRLEGGKILGWDGWRGVEGVEWRHGGRAAVEEVEKCREDGWKGLAGYLQRRWGRVE